MTVTLEQARIMIAETFKKGHELGLKPLSRSEEHTSELQSPD